MEVFKKVLIVVYIISCVVLILITTFQAKDSEQSIEDTYENPHANKYFEKNRSRTKSGRIQKRTIISGIVFAVLTVITTVVCYLYK